MKVWLYTIFLFSNIWVHSFGRRRSHGIQERIVGGESARIGRYRYMAALINSEGVFCGGSLLAPNVALTAGHCGDVGGLREVRVGCRDMNLINTEDNCERFDVVRKTRIEGYDFRTFFNDILIVVIDGDSKNPPISLLPPSNKESLDEFQLLKSVGWGALKEIEGDLVNEEDFPSVLQETTINYVSRENCNTVLRSAMANDKTGSLDNTPAEIVNPNMLCAYKEGTDTCQNDSGGPLIVECGTDENPDDIQVGLVSWGIGCARKGVPGVYANLADEQIFAFIEAAVKEQGHSLKIREVSDECVHLDNDPLEQPTQYPTLPVFGLADAVPFTWACDADFFNEIQRGIPEGECDCCGAQDPDCTGADDELVNFCPDPTSFTCVEGLCVRKVPMEEPVLPEGWNCSFNNFASGDGCDCNCGIVDPDCIQNTATFGCPNGEQCIEALCIAQIPTETPNPPPQPVATRPPTAAPAQGISNTIRFILIGVGAFVLLLALVTMLFMLRRKPKKPTPAQPQEAKALIL